MINRKNATYKFVDTFNGVAPSFTIANKVGVSYASHVGTPTKRGCWRVQISGTTPLFTAHVLEVEQGNGSTLVPVLAGHSYQFVPGVIVTLGATLTDGDIFDADYSQYVPDIA